MSLTNRVQFLRKNKLPSNTSLSIDEIAKVSGIPVKALQEVYNRGTGAYKSNFSSVRLLDFSKNPNTKNFGPSQRLSVEQWSTARVYAFVNKSKKVFFGSDNDIAEKYGLK